MAAREVLRESDDAGARGGFVVGWGRLAGDADQAFLAGDGRAKGTVELHAIG